MEKKDIFIVGLLGLGILSFGQVLGNKWIIIIALLFFLFFVITAKDNLLPILFMYLPWSPVLKISPTSVSFYSVAIAIMLGIHIIKKKKIDVRILVSVMGLALVTFFAKLVNEYEVTLSYVMFLVMLVAFPVIVNAAYEKTSFEICVIFFSFGIVSATLVSYAFSNNPNMMEYIRVIKQEYNGVSRLCGFYGDPNFYSAQIVTTVGCMLAIITQKKKVLLNSLIVIALIVCGLTSLSKSFLLCVFLVFAIWLLIMMLKQSSRYLKILFLGILLTVSVFASGVFTETINQYLVRFSSVRSLSALTTGRTDLWVEYFEFLITNPIDMLIGQGYTNVFNTVHKGSHSTIVQSLYQLGLVGTVMLFFWMKSFYTKRKKGNCLYFVLLLAACFSMWIGLDMMFFDDFFLNISLFFIALHEMEERKQEA